MMSEKFLLNLFDESLLKMLPYDTRNHIMQRAVNDIREDFNYTLKNSIPPPQLPMTDPILFSVEF